MMAPHCEAGRLTEPPPAPGTGYPRSAAVTPRAARPPTGTWCSALRGTPHAITFLNRRFGRSIFSTVAVERP